MKTDAAKKEKRLTYLDAIKTFSLLMVFALHTQRGEQATDPCTNDVLFYAARCCMPLFFMVNGSLILHRSSFDFAYYRKKIFGIVRVLAINGICIGIYVFLFHHFSPAKAVKEMLKGFLSYTSYAYLWFLYSFAIIYTVLLFGFKVIKKRLNYILTALGIICVVLSLISMHSIANGGFFVQANVTQRLRLWTWMFYFCLGYKLSTLMTDNYPPHVVRCVTLLLTAISIGWQYRLCFCMTGQVDSNCMYDDAIIVAYSAAVFLSFKVSPLLSKLFAAFCKYSFGAFLIHGFIIDAFQLRSIPKTPSQAVLVWLGLIAVCWALSWLVDKIPLVRNVLKY